MPVDQSVVGKELPPLTMTVDAGRLRFFAKAIGETNPVFTDLGAAKAAGHRDLPVPPTFLFGIELESPDPFGWLSCIGVDLRRVLHGEQSFTYTRRRWQATCSPWLPGSAMCTARRAALWNSSRRHPQ